MYVRHFKICLLLCLLTAVFGMPRNVHATDYFVRKTGNNGNAGTSAGAAWLTIDYAADSMSPGDTVYVGAGTYSERVTPSPTGTSGSPIRYIADTDGTQTGDAGDVLVTGSSGLQTLVLSNKDYLEFDGFKFKGFGDDAVRVYYADSIVLDNCEIYSGTQGINVTGGNNLTVRNCIIRDNSKDGINTANVNGMIVKGCEIYGNIAGIDVDSGNVTIRNCLLRDNSDRGIDVTVGTVVVQNCTVASNATDGIHLGSGTLTVTNGIIANNGDDGLDYDAGTITHTYNLVYGNSDLDLEGTSLSTGEISVDPLFVSSTDYRVRTLSPAIDAGTDLTGIVDDDIDGTPRPDNGAWDIGCYEMAPDGHWKLDETSGTTAADSSSRGYDGTYINTPTLGGTGVFGNAAELDGVNEHVEVASLSSLDNPKAITVACWAKSGTATWSDYGMLVSKRNQFVMSPTIGTTMLTWYVIDDGGIGQTLAYNLGAIPGFDLQDWHHYACTYDPDLAIQAMYVDGVLINSISRTLTINSDTGSLFIGRDDGWSRYLDGMIDDVRVYTYALNAAELAVLGTPGSTETLVGHWKLDETSGTTALDSSTFGNDGTVNGTATWTNAVHSNGLDVDYTDGEDYVEIPNSSSLENVQEGNYTVATWFKPNSTPPGTGSDNDALYGILLKEGYQCGLIYTNANEFEFHHWITGDVWVGTGTWGTSYPPGRFYHVAGVVDIAAGTAKIYVNGTLVYTNNFTPGTATREYGTAPWRIGIGAPAASIWGMSADGELDDARIYSKALSDSEIAELYGLMGHWKLDETSGTVATDSSPIGDNDGTYVSSPTMGACAPWDTGVELDGTADYVSVPASDTLAITDLSLATWVYFEGTVPSGYRTILEHDRGGTNWYGLWKSNAGDHFHFRWNIPNSTGTADFLTTIAPNTWYHVVGTFDATTGEARMYQNGELVQTVTGGSVPTPNSAATNIGSNSVGTEFMDGVLDDVRIYNRVIGQEEISDLMGLKAYWKLDETSGTTAVDSSANGHDGTLVGSPTWTTTGNVDGALDFEIDDGGDRVDAGTFNVSGSALSVSAWIRSEEEVHDGRILFKSTGNDSADQFWGFTIGESLEPDFRIRAGGTRSILAYSGVVTPGKWYYLAGTYDGTTMRFYINGVEVANMLHAVGGALDEDSTATVALGDSPIGGRAYDGRIDDARIFNRVLCPTEIYGQYKEGRPPGVRIIKWVEVR